MNELPMTDARKDMLRKAQEGNVAYSRTLGRWRVDGKIALGWHGRTLAELRRAGYIVVADSSVSPSPVLLTEEGMKIVTS